MADQIYKVRDPSGRLREIRGPAGASDEEVIAQAKLLFGGETPSKPAPAPISQRQQFTDTAEELPLWKQIAAGAGGALKGMQLGAKQLIGMDVPADELEAYQSAMSGLRGTAGGVVGEFGANVMPGLGVMGAAAKIPKLAGLMAAGGAKGAATIAGLGAATGAAEGALIPVSDADERVTNTLLSGTIGMLSPAVTGGVVKTGQYLKGRVAPMFSRGARQVAAGQMMRDVGGEASIPALRQATPGQTVGQAAVGQNLTELAALQRVANELNPDAPFARDVAARQARVESLRSFGKTPKELAAAEDARDTAYKNAIEDAESAFAARRADVAREFASDPRSVVRTPEYGGTLGNVIVGYKITPLELPVVPALETLKTNPGFKAAIAEARRIAAGKRGLPEELTRMSSKVREDIIADPTKSLQGLELIKFAIDKRFKDPQSVKTALAKIDDATLATLKKTLVGVADELSPEYKAAREAYQTASKDITEMKIGQEAAGVLEQPLGVGERGALFARNVEQEVQLLKKAGGFNRQELAEQLKPENMAKLQKVVDDLDIDATFQQQAASGMRGQRLKDVVGPAVELPHLLNNAVVIANNLVRRIAGGGQVRTLKELSTVMDDPKLAADLMQKASTQEKNALKFLMKAQQRGAIVGVAAAKPALE